MERNQFTFYRSFYEALRRLPKKARLEAYEAIAAYALDGVEPDADGAAATAFLLIRPVLDAARVKAFVGSKGGRVSQANRKQDASKRQAAPKQTRSEDEGEKEIETENEVETEAEREGEGEDQGPPRRGAPAPAVSEGPTFDAVLWEARRRGCEEMARPFYDYYAAAGWRDREGRPVYAWKQKLVLWQQREGRLGARGSRAAPSPPRREDPRAVQADFARMERYLQELREA